MTEPAVTAQQTRLTSERSSSFELYRQFVSGDSSLSSFLYFEFVTLLCANLPAMPGYGLRALLFPALFKVCGVRPAFGRGMVLRQPHRISLGKRVLIDDYAALDVRDDDASIELGDYVSVGRFTTIAAKGGNITLQHGVNIGSYCRIATQSGVQIGESTLVAAFCYIGPGNHQKGDDDTPLIAREMELKGGVKIGAHSWIGAHTTILDGVTIGTKCIVGAHSLVREDVPDGAVVAGTPARIIRTAH